MNCIDCGNTNMVMESMKSVTTLNGDTILTIEEYKCPLCGRLEKKTIIIDCIKSGKK